MSKAIKHIQAGLLHIEVLGSVPVRVKKRRSARAGPTPPAQRLYNLKHSWQELELTIAANFQGHDLVLTFTYDDGRLPPDKAAAGKQFQKFIRRLRGARRKRGAELRYIYVTEGFHAKGTDGPFAADGALEDKRLHHHGVFNVTGPGDLEEIRSLWPGGGYVRAEPVDVHYYRELSKYLTKEARAFGKPKPGERTWRVPDSEKVSGGVHRDCHGKRDPRPALWRGGLRPVRGTESIRLRGVRGSPVPALPQSGGQRLQLFPRPPPASLIIFHLETSLNNPTGYVERGNGTCNHEGKLID